MHITQKRIEIAMRNLIVGRFMGFGWGFYDVRTNKRRYYVNRDGKGIISNDWRPDDDFRRRLREPFAQLLLALTLGA